MKIKHLIAITLLLLPVSIVLAGSETILNLLQTYRDDGAVTASAERGEQLWRTVFNGQGEFGERSCTSCHTQDLTATGRHIKTGKTIKPMAASANPSRFTNAKKVEKWFKRNCKWTLGRECTAQEKSDLLLYMSKPVIF